MREVVLSIRHNDEPESDVSAEYPDVTVRSLSSMTGRGGDRKRIVEMTGNPDSIRSFVDSFRAEPSVRTATPISPLGASRVYVAVVYDAHLWDSISEHLSEMGVHYRNGTVITAGWERWTLYLDDDDDLPTIVNAIERAGNDVRLARTIELSDADLEAGMDATNLTRELTDRQREVLATAIAAGYYRTKRTATIEDVADQVGIARTTAWEHLKRAESKVMEEVKTFLDRPEEVGPADV
jgi:predicted DNA binding protein